MDLKKARRLFPITDQPPDWTLCLSHARRRQLNKACNLARKPADAVLLQVQSDAMHQDMWLYPGCPLIGHLQGKRHGIYNGALYWVTHITPDEEHVWVKNADGDEVRLTTSFVGQSLLLAYAICIYSSQGLTLQGRVRVVDTTNIHFERRHLYVAASRSTSAELLEVE